MSGRGRSGGLTNEQQRLVASLVSGRRIVVLPSGDTTGATDTANIQSAINSFSVGSIDSSVSGDARVVGGGGVVELSPASNYYVTQVSSPPNVLIVGGGMASTSIIVKGAGPGIIKASGGVYGENNLGFADLRVVSDGSSGQNGVLFDTVDDIIVRNVEMQGFGGYGLRLRKSQYLNAFKLHILQCGTGLELQDNSEGGTLPCNNNHFFGLHVFQCGTGVILAGHNNVVHGGTIQGNTVAGLIVRNSTGGSGSFYNAVNGVHFEFHNAVWDVDIESGVIGTEFRSCVLISPSGGKIGVRFVRNAGEQTMLGSCGTTKVDISVGGVASPIEQSTTTGSITVIGGNWGNGLVETLWVCDSAGSTSNTTLRTKRKCINNSGADAFLRFASMARFFSHTVSDGVEVAYSTDAYARVRLSSWDGTNSRPGIAFGNGSSDTDTIIQRSASNVAGMASGDSFSVPDAATGTSSAPAATLRLGNYHLWVDESGRLRIHSAGPSSSTSGVVVGTQT